MDGLCWVVVPTSAGEVLAPMLSTLSWQASSCHWDAAILGVTANWDFRRPPLNVLPTAGSALGEDPGIYSAADWKPRRMELEPLWAIPSVNALTNPPPPRQEHPPAPAVVFTEVSWKSSLSLDRPYAIIIIGNIILLRHYIIAAGKNRTRCKQIHLPIPKAKMRWDPFSHTGRQWAEIKNFSAAQRL